MVFVFKNVDSFEKWLMTLVLKVKGHVCEEKPVTMPTSAQQGKDLLQWGQQLSKLL